MFSFEWRLSIRDIANGIAVNARSSDAAVGLLVKRLGADEDAVLGVVRADEHEVLGVVERHVGRSTLRPHAWDSTDWT